MTAQFDGKVAFITGAARGQGRCHAVRFAEEGADIIAVDICEQIDSVAYPLAGREDLDEAVNLVEKAGRRIVAEQADVRDFARLQSILTDAVAELGRLDFVLANAGLAPGAGLPQPNHVGLPGCDRRDAQRRLLHDRSRLTGDARAE